MTDKKTCDRVIFYCKTTNVKEFKGKKVYESWPKLPHHDNAGALSWVGNYYRKDRHFTVEMDNHFETSYVYEDVNVHGQGAKVPSALVYDEKNDCYLKFDFRTDGLVELIVNGKVNKGVIKSPMGFRYAGSNYYFTMKNSESYKKFEASFKPKLKKKTTSVIDVGVPFIGADFSYFVYLGKYKCVEDQAETTYVPTYENCYVHVYQELAIVRDYPTKGSIHVHDYNKSPVISVSKSKMQVKSVVNVQDPHYNKMISLIVKDKNIKTDMLTKGRYYGVLTPNGIGTFVLDDESKEVKIIGVPQLKNNPCGGLGAGSFGTSMFGFPKIFK